MKRGIRGHDVSASGLKNICQRCQSLGFDYLQLVLEKSIDGFSFGMFSEEYAEKIKEELGGMKVAVLGSYINPSSADEAALSADIEKFKEKIRYASVLKPIVVGTETGVYKNVENEEENDSEGVYLHLLKTMKELAEYAEEYGVRIGIEGVHCFVINTPQKMKRLIDDIGKENVSVIFDPVNYINENNYKHQDDIINTAFDLTGDKIAVIHAKDFILENGKIKRTTAGEGILNYDLIFKRLCEYKNDAVIVSEETDDISGKRGLENLEKIRNSYFG